MKSEHSLTPYTQKNLKMDKRLKFKPDIIEVLEEDIGRILFDINCSIIFLDLSPRVMETNKQMGSN